MAAATGYEIEYRLQSSGQEWTRVRVSGPAVHTLRGLRRGEIYDYRVRGLTADKASGYTTGSFTVATTHREGPLALPPANVGNVGGIWDTGAEATWTATDVLADISVAAGDLLAGDETVSYSASAGQIAGTASEVKTVHLYYDDPTFAGGLRTLGITESLVTARTGHGRIYIATLVITFDTLGGGGTGGGGGIGGGGGGSGQIEP